MEDEFVVVRSRVCCRAAWQLRSKVDDQQMERFVKDPAPGPGSAWAGRSEKKRFDRSSVWGKIRP